LAAQSILILVKPIFNSNSSASGCSYFGWRFFFEHGSFGFQGISFKALFEI
jgi:hypothetical protein